MGAWLGLAEEYTVVRNIGSEMTTAIGDFWNTTWTISPAVGSVISAGSLTVSYTHLTLPTKA